MAFFNFHFKSDGWFLGGFKYFIHVITQKLYQCLQFEDGKCSTLQQLLRFSVIQNINLHFCLLGEIAKNQSPKKMITFPYYSESQLYFGQNSQQLLLFKRQFWLKNHEQQKQSLQKSNKTIFGLFSLWQSVQPKGKFIVLPLKKNLFNVSFIIIVQQEMFVDQIVKLEDNRMSSMQDRQKSCGPFKLSRPSSEEVETYEKSGQWSVSENAKYAAFIEANARRMEGKPHGKLWALYHEMEKFIKSRNFRQCKSHHQKMVNQHSTIPDVLSSLLRSSANFKILLEKERQAYSSQNEVQKVNESMPFPGTEKYDEKNLPATGTTYENQGDETDLGMKSDNKLNSFASLIPSGFSGLSNPKRGNQFEEEWRQCHNLFLEWTGRLNNLMRPSFGF